MDSAARNMVYKYLFKTLLSILMVKSLSTMRETQVQALGWEDPLEKEMAIHSSTIAFPGGSDGKASVFNVEDPCSSPGLGRSPGEGNGNQLQYYCLENPMHIGAW